MLENQTKYIWSYLVGSPAFHFRLISKIFDENALLALAVVLPCSSMWSYKADCTVQLVVTFSLSALTWNISLIWISLSSNLSIVQNVEIPSLVFVILMTVWPTSSPSCTSSRVNTWQSQKIQSLFHISFDRSHRYPHSYSTHKLPSCSKFWLIYIELKGTGVVIGKTTPPLSPYGCRITFLWENLLAHTYRRTALPTTLTVCPYIFS